MCGCGLEKAWNGTEPLLDADERSIPCEMNKFDDMMELLSAEDPHFAQVVAIDADFVLFSRAWCVAEVAAAHKVGMRQSMEIESLQSLDDHDEGLRQLRIEAMEATRPEDKDEILRKIPDHAAFDEHVQLLLFQDLLPAWRHLDVAMQLDRVGHYVRWQLVARRRGSLGIFDPRQQARDNPGAQIVGAPSTRNVSPLP